IAGLEPAESDYSFVTAFALAAAAWHIDAHAASSAYVWSWLENQVAAATKLVPLGQSAAQRLLLALTEYVPAVVAKSTTVDDDDIGASLPSLALASAWHETQYCRLFQS
ncbi:MAG: urease accessory protein UreF, partial [Pseudomonadales bacterium]